MSSEENSDQSSEEPSSSAAFPQTRWTILRDAQGDDQEALEELCRIYWYPLYCYARRLTPNPDDAKDLTQGFFARLLSDERLRAIESERGRLRSYLCRSMNNYSASQWKAGQALKRGAGVLPVAIDGLEAEERYAVEPRDDLSPEVAFDRAWARQLLDSVLEKLGSQYEASGKAELFAQLKERLVPGGSARPYAEIAQELGIEEPVVRFTAFRMRGRFREMLKEVIAETVSSEEEAAEELRHLRTVFG